MDYSDYEMPTPCKVCGDIFELTDGRASPKEPNTTICGNCAENEQHEVNAIKEYKDLTSDLKFLVEENTDFRRVRDALQEDLNEANSNIRENTQEFVVTFSALEGVIGRLYSMQISAVNSDAALGKAYKKFKDKKTGERILQHIVVEIK